jgi:hypothetical protein
MSETPKRPRKPPTKQQGILNTNQFSIEVSGTVMNIIYPNGDLEIFTVFPSMEIAKQHPDEHSAYWDQEQLVLLANSSGQGANTVQRLTVSPDGSQLHVAITMSARQRSKLIRRVFNRSDGAPSRY